MSESALSVQPVILCGGAGTRLWPLSRAGFPKQFLCLAGDQSLFQQAVQRSCDLAADDIALAAPLIVCNEDHRFLALEQLREISTASAALLLEPVARNTAAALSLAALAAMETAAGGDGILVVTPSDHAVAALPAFTRAMQAAIREAGKNSIVILGVKPDRAETGYGYIRSSQHDGVSLAPTGEPLTVQAFVEKPDLATAQVYFADGNYFWNAGMFVLKASVWMAALDSFRPDIAAATRLAWSQRTTDQHFIRPGNAEFAAVPSESVDYAVMEHCPGSRFPIRMVPLAAGWSDLGAWDAVWQVAQKDPAGNACVGDVLVTAGQHNYVHATSRLVSLVGVSDLVVVETADAVLVADRTRAQEVKAIVETLRAQDREEHTLHRKVHRPWGWYDSIDEGERFKVKRILVNPGASLSLQMHHQRAEHWIVVKGVAEVTCGDSVRRLSENQSTYIPLGETHRLANPGDTPLEIIEVQSGNYLGEDDIVRFDDVYGRSAPTKAAK